MPEGYRQRYEECGPVGVRCDGDIAVMLSDDIIRDVEAKAGSLARLFSGEESIEKARESIGRNLRSVVCDLNLDAVAFLAAGSPPRKRRGRRAPAMPRPVERDTTA